MNLIQRMSPRYRSRGGSVTYPNQNDHHHGQYEDHSSWKWTSNQTAAIPSIVSVGTEIIGGGGIVAGAAAVGGGGGGGGTSNTGTGTDTSTDTAGGVAVIGLLPATTADPTTNRPRVAALSTGTLAIVTALSKSSSPSSSCMLAVAATTTTSVGGSPGVGWSLGKGRLGEDGIVDHWIPSPQQLLQQQIQQQQIQQIQAAENRGDHCHNSTMSPRPQQSFAMSPLNSMEHDDDEDDSISLQKQQYQQSSQNRSSSSLISIIKDEIVKQPFVFKRRLCSFLRVADLHMDENGSLTTCSTATDDVAEFLHPNYHFGATDPPPGLDADPNERWIVIDDGAGNHAPIAPKAIDALTMAGRNGMMHQTMWTADYKTAKLCQKYPTNWHLSTWQWEGMCHLGSHSNRVGAGTTPALTNVDPMEREILVWSGTFSHGYYGSDLPAVRFAAVMDVSADDLLHLLVDSNRVREYNKLSLGRTDELVLQADMNASGPFGGITKVMKSRSKPPMLGKILQFTSILHARALPDGSGYLIVTRAVHTAHHPTTSSDHVAATNISNNNSSMGVLTSEILLGVNLLKRCCCCCNNSNMECTSSSNSSNHHPKHRCLLVAVNHIRSPMIPMMIAKRIGLQAAHNFVTDLRIALTTTSSPHVQ